MIVIQKMNTSRKIVLLIAVLLALLSVAKADPCPQLCQYCTSNTCMACYQDWPSTSGYTFNPSCGCPVGYYMNSTTRLCNFCPVQCISCNGYTSCTKCLEGYRLSNGACVGNFANSTIQFGLDLNNSAISQNSTYGFQFDGSASTSSINSYFGVCSNTMFNHQPMLGKFGAFDYDSKVYKTYYGLPYHQWASIKFQFFVIDLWEGQELIVQIESGRNQNPTTFNSALFSQPFMYSESIRSVDFCGMPQYSDNLGIFNQTFPHTDSILKFRIRTSLADVADLPPNYDRIYFGIRQVLLIVGLCPKSCLTCVSKTLCTSCAPLYTLNANHSCTCDLSVALMTANGQCIKQCIDGAQVYLDNKCKQCGQLFAGCLQCANRTTSQLVNSTHIYKCVQCSAGKFLYQGVCANVCPSGFYEQFVVSALAPQICTRCPTGCYECDNNEYYSSFTNSPQVICVSCSEGYVWYNGVCSVNCSVGTYPNARRTQCIDCPEGCVSCTAIACTQCLNATASSGLLYVNQSGICVLACMTGDPYNPATGCPNTTCTANCLSCFGNNSNHCYICDTTHYLQDYQCLTQCSVGYYQVSPVDLTCLKCPQQCKTCTAYQCLTCNVGYWLLNGQCVRLCPATYYPATVNTAYQCLKCTDPNCNVCTELPAAVATARSAILQCQQCKYGYFLDSQGACAPVKPTCPQTFYYNIQVQDCVACPLNCLQCQSTLCLLCQSNKILNNGVCVDQCPAEKIATEQLRRVINSTTVIYMKCAWIDPLCETYTGGVCSQCIHVDPSLILYQLPNSTQTTCLYSCPDGYSRTSSINTTCTVSCPSDCLECDSQANCKKCAPGYLIFANGCTQSCPQYYISDSIQCIRCDVNCLRCQQDGKCVECRSGLVVTSAGNCVSPSCTISEYNNTLVSCVVCASPCATCTARATECTSCVSSYYLRTDGTCSQTCLNDQFIDTVSRTCRTCRPSCSTCTNFQNCTKCITGYYWLKTSATTAYCVSECPPATFISVVGLPSCLPCKFPCRSCYGPNEYQCLECLSGYVMDYTTCVSKCPAGKYEDQYGHCDFCHPTCKECFGPADFQCQRCHHHQDSEDDDYQDGFEYEGRCYMDGCPGQTYYDDDQSECRECPQNCRTCTSSGYCLSCNEQTVYFNGSCIQTCPLSTYYNYYREYCSSCSSFNSSCAECTASGCTRCVEPYYRYDRYCRASCPVGTYAADHNLKQCLPCPQNCYNCTSPTSCKACKGQLRLRNGICLEKCLAGYYYSYRNRTCYSCSISRCSICYYNQTSTRTNCTYCQNGYTLVYNSLGLPQCTPYVPNTCSTGFFLSLLSGQCQPCHISCISCFNTSTNCTACKSGFRLVNNLCITPVTPPSCIANCSICSSTTACILCHLPYLLMPALGTCVSSCPNEYYAYMRECHKCVEGCLTCTSNAYQCGSCKNGFYLLETRCVRECPDGYFLSANTTQLYNGTCSLCSDYIEGCEICANFTTCILCKSQYSLLQNTSKCILKPNCPLGYFYSYQSQGCMECSSNCVQCLTSQTCINCQAGYIQFNGACMNTSCPVGTFLQIVEYPILPGYISYTLRYTSAQCTNCAPPCASCVNQQTCLTCLGGYVLANNTCRTDCGVEHYISNSTIPTCQKCSEQCLSCQTNSTTCTSCRPGFYLSSRKCVADCPIGMYASQVDSRCRACGSYCLQCNTSSTCLICYDGLWLLDGQCVATCPPGYAGTFVEFVSALYNKMVGVCKQCESPCSTCSRTTSQYECQSCSSGFYLYQSRCLVTCPSGFFANPTTSQCTPCPSWCLTCTSYQSCQTCTSPQCQQPCELTTPPSCIQCESSCKYCDKSTVITVSSTYRLGTCLQCVPPYHLNAGRCVLTCPTGTYLDVFRNLCVGCVGGCVQCVTDGKCTVCNTTAYLYEGVCYAACPAFTMPFTATTNNTTTRICILNPCISPTSSSGCTSCLNPYILYNSQCTQNCPNSTYKSASSNTCEQCPSECRLCTSYSNCTLCASGYLMQMDANTGSWGCVRLCTAGLYKGVANGVNACVPCAGTIPNCKLCQDNDTCQVCNTGLVLLFNAATNATSCVTACPNGFYSDSVACQPCLDSTCQVCAYSATSGYSCLICRMGTYLVPSLGQCVDACMDGYFVAGANNVTGLSCQKCPPQCLKCNSTTNCSQCSLGYALTSTGQCTTVCPFGTYRFSNTTLSSDQCLSCNSTGCVDCIIDPILKTSQVCTLCLQGWFVLNGVCYNATCPAGYFPISSQCRKCSNPCLECTSPTQCTRCYNGSILNPSTSTCTSTCSAAQFYQQSTRTCQSCSQECYQCYGFRFDQCLSCVQPLVLIGSTCVMVCPMGYVQALDYSCVRCDATCKQCTGSGLATECTSCPVDSFLYNLAGRTPAVGQCVKSCPASTYAYPPTSQCIPCSSLPMCSQCAYSPTDSSPKCTKCATPSITVLVNNEVTCKPSNYVCPANQMYVNQLSQCVPCAAPCVRCSLSTSGTQTVCYECATGYVWVGGQCYTQCSDSTTPVTLASTVYNGVTLSNVPTCQPCQQTNCLKCSITTGTTTQCSVCTSPYILYNGNCVQDCGNAQLLLKFNTNTLLWQCVSSTITVQDCQSKGLLSYVNSTGQTVCVDVCPTLYYANSTTSRCQACSIGCYNCTDSGSCLACLAGFYKYNNLCATDCPVGFVGVSGTCFKCISPCSTCAISLSKCTACIAGYYLLQGTQCVQTCPAGYYLPSSSLSCSPCSPKCNTCSSPTGACLTCVNTQYTAPACTDTTNVCLSYQYRTTASTCANCSTSCATCYGPADYQCILCAGSYVMMDGICLPTCPTGFYAFTNAAAALECGSCSSRIAYCLTCTVTSSTATCSQCDTPYFLSPDNSRCILTCSQLNANSIVYSRSSTNPSQCIACTASCILCSDQNCLSCSSGLFLYNGVCNNACPAGSYAVVLSTGNSCAPCGAGCTVCYNGQTCIDCDGTLVLSAGKCVTTCPIGFYPLTTSTTVNSVTYSQPICTACNVTLPYCTTCQVVAVTPACTQCIAPYLVINGRCGQCQSSYFYQQTTQTCLACSSTCLTCSSLAQCNSCATGLYMSNGQCVYICPAGMFPNPSTLQCNSCSDGNCNICAATSTGTSQCSSCKTGYYLISTTLATQLSYTGPSCVQTCPLGTSPSTSTQTCQPCTIISCSSCPIVSTCNECLPNLYLTSDNKCVATCPSGTAALVVANGADICTPCKVGCVNCSNGGNTCVDCLQGLTNNGDGSCSQNTSTCASGQYIVQSSPLQCGACHTSCLTCYGGASSQCLTCRQPGYSYQNGYCITVCTSSQFYSAGLGSCQSCNSQCLTCTTTSTTCTSCPTGTYLTASNTCSNQCVAGTYLSSLACKPCPTYCATCTSEAYCTACTGAATIMYNSICYTACPTGTYIASGTGSGLNTCASCPVECLSCTSLTACQSCASSYYLHQSQCIQQCPQRYYADSTTNRCQQCETSCLECTSATDCMKCELPSTLSLGNCLPNCPTANYMVTTAGFNYCHDCSSFCVACTSSTSCTECQATYKLIQNYADWSMSCTDTCPSGYHLTLVNTTIQFCDSDNCLNCASCVGGQCQQCQPNWFLQNSACTQSCQIGTYGATDTWKCQSCMENCLICPNATYCSQCTDGYNFSISLDNRCVSEGIFVYGPIANISGFTSNITEVTSLVYLSTSAGPVFFGEMSSTYFNIEFCQFMFFHDGVAGNSSQMKTFLQSLSFMSMSSIGSGSSSTNSTRRLLLQTESLSFLQINLPIFIMMGCFLVLYGLTFLIGKYIDSMCLSCPNFNFYVKEICIYLANRFKWIYFDFVVWLSYLPFLFFSIKQVQKFNFNSGLQGFSSIFSILVLATYPLYPLLIAYNIKKNYVALCMENDKMVEMSLSPWVYKVKRPQFIPNEDEAFVYCSKANFILLYYPLKYFRKFIFVLVVVVCPNPIASLCVLLGLNIVFIGYMGAFRPRTMPYMIFDFILQGVMLGFQIFMVVYMALDSVKITAMTIVTHAFGFITANLSIIVAIVLNIVAYYKIFMCIYELYQHLKEKVEEKEKLEAKQKDPIHDDEMMSENTKQKYVQEFINNTDFVLDEKELDKRHRNDDSLTEEEAKIEDLGRPEREIANLLSDKDLLMNNIQPRYDGEIEGNDNNFRGLFDDKELYGDVKESNKDKFQVYGDDELPTMKAKKDKKDKKDKKQKEKQKDLRSSNKNDKTQKKQQKKGLNDTNEYMLRRKEEQWIEQDKEENLLTNNYSEQRLNMQMGGSRKPQSIMQLNANKVQLREKSKTLRQEPIKSNKDSNLPYLKAQQNNKKDKGIFNNNDDLEERNLKNNSTLSNNSHKSGDNLLQGESPERILTKDRQGTKIDVKEGEYSGRNNKKYVKPIEKQFDEFEEGDFADIPKDQKKKKDGDQEYQQNEPDYRERKNAKNGKDPSNENLATVELEQRKKKLKGQKGSQNQLRTSKKTDKNSIADLVAKQRGQKQKSKGQQGEQLAQGNLKQRQRSKNKLNQSKDSPSKLGQVADKEKKNKILGNFFEDQQQFEEIPTAQKVGRKEQKQIENVQQGLLMSRKPAGQNRNQQSKDPEDLLYKDRVNKSKQKPSFQTKLRSNGEKEVEQGRLRNNSKNKQAQYTLKNRNNENQEYILEGVGFNERNRSQNQKNKPNIGSNKEVEQSLFSERVKNQAKQAQLQAKFKNREIQELQTKERQSKKKEDEEQQNEEGNSEGFFSNLFGLNRKTPKIENQFGFSGQSNSNPNSTRIKHKQGNQEFEESNTGRIRKEKVQEKRKSKDKGLKMGDDGFNQDYEQIKRKNKDSMIKPKINYGTLNLDNSNEFEESNYSRPASRMKRESDSKDGGLNMDRRGSEASDNEDYTQTARKARATNKQKMRVKGNLDIKDQSINIDDSQISRKRKQEQQLVIRRGGKGALKVDQLAQDQQDLQNIQL